jgi:hypothetical protein
MATPEPKSSRDGTQEQFTFVQEECKRLREENARLRAMLGIPESVGAGTAVSHTDVSAADSSKSGDLSTPEGKITLFRSLFRGREDIYAVRWEGKEENQAIRQQQPWTGERSMLLGQRNASALRARHVCCFL